MTGKSQSVLTDIGSFMKDNPLVSGLALGAGTQLLGSLFSPSGNSSGNQGDMGYNNAYCASGAYYYSANPPPGDPCAVYSPGGGTTLPTDGAQSTSISDLLNDLGGTATTTINIDDGDDLDLATDGCSTISALINCPDGYKEQDQGLDDNGCKQEPLCVVDDSATTTDDGQPCGSGFCSPDMYCSTVQPGQCVPNGRVDCGTYSCDAGLACSEDEDNKCVDPDDEQVDVVDLIDDEDLYDDDTDENTPDPSETDLNQAQIPVPADGVHGDLLSFGGGVTIYGRSRSGGTEVSGFFGGSSTGGLCSSRPWATNFLSYVIPPSFFDGLCSMAGFGSGQVSTGFGGGSTHNVTGPSSPTYTPPPPQTGVRPEAKIRASPPTINLGGRTTVFWTSHDVSSCEEYSSDGNFSGSSTSGGASTVALSGPVTFYIRCLGVDGVYIQDSTTVNIGI
ncbi:hypothetical protein C4568_04590 [Candidatus Parcubacteria bacterium]|nr:MAG: hypothetical protein C4568_04590 [Candidatus Parcubacteria bacterium]